MECKGAKSDINVNIVFDVAKLTDDLYNRDPLSSLQEKLSAGLYFNRKQSFHRNNGNKGHLDGWGIAAQTVWDSHKSQQTPTWRRFRSGDQLTNENKMTAVQNVSFLYPPSSPLVYRSALTKTSTIFAHVRATTSSISRPSTVNSHPFLYEAASSSLMSTGGKSKHGQNGNEILACFMHNGDVTNYQKRRKNVLDWNRRYQDYVDLGWIRGQTDSEWLGADILSQLPKGALHNTNEARLLVKDAIQKSFARIRELDVQESKAISLPSDSSEKVVAWGSSLNIALALSERFVFATRFRTDELDPPSLFLYCDSPSFSSDFDFSRRDGKNVCPDATIAVIASEPLEHWTPGRFALLPKDTLVTIDKGQPEVTTTSRPLIVDVECMSYFCLHDLDYRHHALRKKKGLSKNDHHTGHKEEEGLESGSMRQMYKSGGFFSFRGHVLWTLVTLLLIALLCLFLYKLSRRRAGREGIIFGTGSMNTYSSLKRH
eukprot:g1338.t1